MHIQVSMKMTKQEHFILVTVQPEKMKTFLTTFALSVEDQLKKDFLIINKTSEEILKTFCSFFDSE